MNEKTGKGGGAQWGGATAFIVFCFSVFLFSFSLGISPFFSVLYGWQLVRARPRYLGFMGFSDTGRMVLGAMKDGLFLILCSSLWVDCVMFIPLRRGRNETTLVYYSIS